MEAFLLYLLKATALLSLFLLFYRLFLYGETHFRVSRWFLLGSIPASFGLPFITWTRYKEVLVELQPVFVQSSTIVQTTPEAEPSALAQLTSWQGIVLSLYGLTALFLIARLLIKSWNLTSMLRQHPQEKKEGFRFVELPERYPPFSFFRYIAYNPEAYSSDELEAIITHEKAHARQLHSMDILLAELMLCLHWFNPLAWWYRKTLEQNLEFLADQEATAELDSSRAYQKTLLKLSIQQDSPALSTSFFNSLIKKRIVMINQKPSSPWKRWKFVLVFPLIAAFLLSFNTKEVLKYTYTNAEEVQPWEVAFISPLAVNQIYKITSGFGPAKDPISGSLRQHKGIDLSAKAGIPVYASSDGTVEISEYNEKNGEYLRLKHQEGYATRYLHLQKRLVEQGQNVKVGDLIGFVGSTGLSTGPHLHFEILLNDTPQDPLEFIDFGRAEIRFSARMNNGKPKTAQGGVNTVRQPRKPMEGVKTIDLIINSSTSDAELEKIKADLAKDGIDFSYTVVRNEDKEIVSIELRMNGKGENGAEFNGNYNLNGDEPISPIAIHYDDESNQISFGNMEFKGKRMQVGNTFVISGDRMHNDDEHEIIILKEGDSLNWKTTGDTIRFIAKTIDVKGGESEILELRGTSKVIRIDEEKGTGRVIHIDADHDEDVEMEVIEIREEGKRKSKRVKSTKRSKSSASDDGHSRVVIRSKGDGGRVKVISDSDEDYVLVRTNGDEDPLYVVDGKVVKKKKMSKINPKNIESVNVLKGDSAKEKYGRKGKNGVVEIITKKE